jgi:hypothetical protein
MEILGHSQITLTMNTYSHVAPEVSREAAERMAQMLWQDADEADADDEADDEDSAGGDDQCAPLLLALLLGWHSGWYRQHRQCT